METKVRQNNYITILGWMVSDLKLRGNALLTYAIIYGFSQNGDDSYTGSRQYLAEWTNSTVQNVSRCLKKLLEDGLIIKKENVINGVKFCEYKAVVPELLPGTKCSGGSNKMFHNNIEDNTSNNIYSAKFDVNDAFKKFWSTYPRHTNKKKAFIAFAKNCKDETIFQKILNSVADYKKTEQWQDEKFIPHASTWLNGERWEDEIKAPSKDNLKDNDEWMNDYE